MVLESLPEFGKRMFGDKAMPKELKQSPGSPHFWGGFREKKAEEKWQKAKQKRKRQKERQRQEEEKQRRRESKQQAREEKEVRRA